MQNGSIGKLIECLEKETAELAKLADLLDKETEILKARKYEDLESLSIEKEKLSLALEAHTAARLKLLDSGETPANAAGALQALLSHAKETERQKIQTHNTQLQTLLQQVRDRNTVNGQVISANMNIRQELVERLSGKNFDKSARYTAAGTIEKAPEPGRHQEV